MLRMFRGRRNERRRRAASPTPEETNRVMTQELRGLTERLAMLQDRLDERELVPRGHGHNGNDAPLIELNSTASPPVQANDLAADERSMTMTQLDALTQEVREISRKIDDDNASRSSTVFDDDMERRMDMLLAKVDKIVKKDEALSDEEKPAPLDPSPVGTQFHEHNNVTYNVTGYRTYEPSTEVNYFPGLSWTANGPESKQVISCIIPCFNEDSHELSRTIKSLFAQFMNPGWRVEAVIVLDGVDHISDTMVELLTTLFGIEVRNPNDPKLNPFLAFPEADIMILHAADQENCCKRQSVMANTLGGYSLVVKRTNRRKANSQMWWLGAHAESIRCVYALATDCGTVFEKNTTALLIDRLTEESDLQAVTGFQRTMSSRMQGDSTAELCTAPFDFMLRMMQRFEFEVDHVGFKSVDDSLGAMHVIPGPCGLYRYKSLGTLKTGLMHHYFQIFRRRSSGLIIGNVELVEDRIPGALLSFPLKPSKKKPKMPSTGWSRTGYCHGAIFYLEAEKPLSQLVKQRRRWLNGTFATYLWLIAEGIISKSNQAQSTRVISWILVCLHILQGLTVRFAGPALLMVWTTRFGLFLPDIFDEPQNIFDPTIALKDLEEEPIRIWGSVLIGGGYTLLYVWFVIAHTPQAVPVETDTAIVRYTEATQYRSDKSSSFRPLPMTLSVLINIFVVFLFIANAAGIVYTLGWDETPLVVKVLLAICVVPFALSFFDCTLRCDFRSFFQMTFASVVALPMMVWHTVWLPAYATTRASDLTWGNRGSDGCDKSELALQRAQRGQKLAATLILTNICLAIFVMWRMHINGEAFPRFVLIYTIILSIPFLLSFIEMIFRIFSCLGGGRSVPPVEDDIPETFAEYAIGDTSDFGLMTEEDKKAAAEKKAAEENGTDGTKETTDEAYSPPNINEQGGEDQNMTNWDQDTITTAEGDPKK